MSRLGGATDAIIRAVATAAAIPLDQVGPDDDLVDDLNLNPLERESFGLIVEEVFSIRFPLEVLMSSPLYRTPAALAEWCIRKSDLEAAEELQRQRKRA